MEVEEVNAVSFLGLVLVNHLFKQLIQTILVLSPQCGSVDSPELPETPKITEMMENFMKVTKYLAKFKETLKNYVWKKSHVKKQ